MFDFIFKRRASAVSTAAPVLAATTSTLATAERKHAAIAQAKALDGDESAAVAFILQCDFADARIIAAQHVQSQALLERLLPPMRKSDRRVARLMQQRLEAIAQQQRAAQQAQGCMDSAQQLLNEPHLLPNQVAELDRAWQAIAAPAELPRAQYQALRAALDARLLAQSALQRAAIDTLTHWRQLQQTLAAAESLPPDQEIARALEILEGAMANHLAAAEAASLPRHFQAEFEQQRAAFHATWQQAQQRDQALAARRQALAAWQAAPDSWVPAVLQRQWQALPALDGGAAALVLEQQFQALLANRGAPQATPAAHYITEPGAPRPSDAHARQVRETLQALENALEAGALQDALDCDSVLRGPDLKPVALSPAQAARLGTARAELARLQGWAKWGGNISRAELLKAAQELPAKALAPPELGKQVGALRARWKALDTSAGAAAKEVWHQFDAACTLAYAPAAEHFGKQAEQRRTALAQAEALLAQIRQYAQQLARQEGDSADLANPLDPAAIDWKEVAGFCSRMQQAWHRLGHLDRKDKKRLEREIEAALQVLQQPLAQQQAVAIARRQQLIASAQALNPAERDTPEALRALQQRWQEMAQAVPLERKHEQQLWQDFRGACDAFFAQRKQAAASAEQQRRDNLQQKEALCQSLEAALDQAPAAIRPLIAQSQAAWTRIGHVPRALEQPLEQRRQAALAALQTVLDQARRGALAAGFEALRGKLALCQEVEQGLTNDPELCLVAQQQAAARWQALAPLAVEFDAVLRRRFDAACAAAHSGRREYAAQLEGNRARLLQELLQLEILNGVDSPPQWARQRLQLQVEVLAAKLKRGDAALATRTQLRALCELPALADEDARARIDRLLLKAGEL